MSLEDINCEICETLVIVWQIQKHSQKNNKY